MAAYYYPQLMARTPLKPATKRRGQALKARLKTERGPRTQEEVAQVAGLPLATLKAIEDPRRNFNPGFLTVVDLANALGLSLLDLASSNRVPRRGRPA